MEQKSTTDQKSAEGGKSPEASTAGKANAEESSSVCAKCMHEHKMDGTCHCGCENKSK